MKIPAIFSWKRLFVTSNRTATWDSVIKWLLILIVFLLPIFFLAPNSHPIEFNKVIIFNILILITTALFLLKSLLQREIIIARTFIDWFLLAYIFFCIVSFIFSKNHYISLVGIGGYYSAGLVSIICYILFFYLIINVVEKKRDIFLFLGTLLISSVLVIIYNFFQVNGVSLLPWGITKNIGFDLIASSSITLSIFIGVCIFISFGLLVYLKKKWQVVLIGFFVLLSLTLLFFLNKDIAYYILALGLFIFLLLITTKSKQLSNWWVVLPTIILTIIVLFIFIDSGDLISVQVSETILLDQKTSLTIAWESFTRAPLWGSGPQTFAYDYNLWRPTDFNNSILWDLRFIKASNEWFGLWATIGIGGLLALLFVGFWFLVNGGKQIISLKKPDDNWKLSVILFVAWFIIFLSSFLMPFSFIMHFLWWLLLGLSIKTILSKKIIKKTYSLKKSSSLTSVFIGILIIKVTVVIAVIFFSIKLWIADNYFIRAQEGIQKQQEISMVEDYLYKAIKYNPYEVKYHLSLAQGYATQAQLQALDSGEDLTVVQQFAQKVIDTLNDAKKIDPNNPVVYEQEAALYDSLRNLISNVDELSIDAFTRLVEVDPINPLAWLNLGRSRLLYAQGMMVAEDEQIKLQANQLVDQAISNFIHTSELKKDFDLPLTGLALAYEIKGDYGNVAKQLKKLLNKYPESIDLHWQLALVYEKIGEVELSISELETALQLEPGNAQIIEKMNQLKGEEDTDNGDSGE